MPTLLKRINCNVSAVIKIHIIIGKILLWRALWWVFLIFIVIYIIIKYWFKLCRMSIVQYYNISVLMFVWKFGSLNLLFVLDKCITMLHFVYFQTWPFSFQAKSDNSSLSPDGTKSDKDSGSSISDDHNLDDLVGASPWPLVDLDRNNFLMFDSSLLTT